MRLAVISAYLVLVFCLHTVHGHIPDTHSTPSNKIEQYCEMAETCVHDTIAVCGKQVDEKKTFLDICDLLEYNCDANQNFMHVDDMPGCPAKRLAPGEVEDGD